VASKVSPARAGKEMVMTDGSRLGVLDGYVGIPLRLAHRSILTQVNELLADVKLTPVEFALLATIVANPDAVFGEIGDLLGIKKGNLAPLVARMQRRGMIKREASKIDARRQHLSLTAAGRKGFALGTKLHDALEAHLVKHLGQAVHDDLVKLLYTVANIPPVKGDADAMDGRAEKYSL
jgi:DNA-binding MarR family transcriptional regulator